jgi:hypothetical protein
MRCDLPRALFRDLKSQGEAARQQFYVLSFVTLRFEKLNSVSPFHQPQIQHLSSPEFHQCLKRGTGESWVG